MTLSTTPQQGFVDIHCHLLPGIDDGSQSWEESLQMAHQMVADGIDTVVVTPHQLGVYGGTRGETVRNRTAQLQQWLDANQVALQVLAGADVRIDEDMLPRLRSGDCLTLADQRRHVLLELPHELYYPLDLLLQQLADAGLVSILSHPERNQGILRQPQVIPQLVQAGCLMQVTAASLCGDFGPEPEQMARHIVANGWCHFIATDSHGSRKRPPRLRPAHELACQMVGRPLADAMCCQNPRAVAEGRDIAKLPSVQATSHWFERAVQRWRQRQVA